MSLASSQRVSGNTEGQLLKALVNMKHTKETKLMYHSSSSAGGRWCAPNLRCSHSEKAGGLERFLLLGNIVGNIVMASPSPAAAAGTCETHSTDKVGNCFLQRQR